MALSIGIGGFGDLAKVGWPPSFSPIFGGGFGSIRDGVLSCRTGPLRVGRPFDGLFLFAGCLVVALAWVQVKIRHCGFERGKLLEDLVS